MGCRPAGVIVALCLLIPQKTPAEPQPDTHYSDSWPASQPVVHPKTRQTSSGFFSHPIRVTGGLAHGQIALTFDDGPSPKHTPAILDILDRFRVPAAFFVVGRRFVGRKRGPTRGRAILKDIVRRGHLVGNHTVAHKNLRSQHPREARNAIADNASLIDLHITDAAPLFRPPYGANTPELRRYLRRRGDVEVLWSIDTKDFHYSNPKTLRNKTVTSILRRNGGVVLFHDTKAVTRQALVGVLADLERSNCAKLALDQRPIIPVSLHYFVEKRMSGPVTIPPQVEEKRRNYLKYLGEKCTKPVIDKVAVGD